MKESFPLSCDDMYWCCGISEIGGYSYETRKDVSRIKSGTGLAVATFNNEKPSQEAYAFLTKHFKVLYQSPAFPNAVHNNESEVFLVVFQVNKEKALSSDYDFDDYFD